MHGSNGIILEKVNVKYWSYLNHNSEDVNINIDTYNLCCKKNV